MRLVIFEPHVRPSRFIYLQDALNILFLLVWPFHTNCFHTESKRVAPFLTVLSLWCCLVLSSLHLYLPSFVFSVLSFPSFPQRFLSSLSSSVPPPAPSVLHLGGRAGVGLLLGDPGGKRLGSQPSITGGEPLQCASEDSQVDPDQHRPLWIFCLFSSFHFSACFCRVSFSFWLILGLLQPYCHWPPGWYQTKLLHAHSGDSCCFWRDHFSTS